MTSDYGPWAPLSVGDVRRLLEDASFPWWFTGGIALELHTGCSWRGHSVLWTQDGLPYLAPELQLLFESGSPRAKDGEDLLQCVRLMEVERVRALEELLPAEHPWRTQVRAALARAPEA